MAAILSWPQCVKRPLKINGHLGNRELTSLVREATGDFKPQKCMKSA